VTKQVENNVYPDDHLELQMTADAGNGPDPGTDPWVARPAGWFAPPGEPGRDDQPIRADAYDLGLVPSDQVADDWLVAADDEPPGYWYDDDTQEPEGPTVPAEGEWRGSGISREQPEVTEDDAGPWDESALQAPPVFGVRRGPRSRPVGRTALKVGIPVVVIAAVAVGAAMTLTGKTQGKATIPPGQARTAGTAGRSGATDAGAPGMAVSAAVLPGYPGRGVSGELVEGVASANGIQLAVGAVDGLPAVWRRAGTGPWSLVTQNTAGITDRAAVLTNIHLSPRGWIAIGAPGGGSAPHPVVLVSADGRSWQVVDGEPSFGGPGGYSSAIAAGRSEDVVVGKVVNGGRTAAATWWSTDLHNWVRDGTNGGLDGRLEPSLMNAATVTPQRFVAVGQHGRLPAVWLAGLARDWTVMDLPMPAGATSAALTKVAASGDRIIALGNAATSRGTVPFAVTSADGGASWREVPIAAPSGRTATVTALTVTASGFTAAAQASGTNAIYWTSADGTAWSAPRQADPGITAITGLIPAGATVTGIGQSPAGHPVIWAARR
jgi:hypothetical protein